MSSVLPCHPPAAPSNVATASIVPDKGTCGPVGNFAPTIRSMRATMPWRIPSGGSAPVAGPEGIWGSLTQQDTTSDSTASEDGVTHANSPGPLSHPGQFVCGLLCQIQLHLGRGNRGWLFQTYRRGRRSSPRLGLGHSVVPALLGDKHRLVLAVVLQGRHALLAAELGWDGGRGRRELIGAIARIEKGV